MAAHAFAMEATTMQCAAFIDRGAEDYMLETAMLKVFATDALWTIVNDTMQIYGGQGYFSDEPYERMMRDARINTIGEGANEVLKAFIAVVGMRGVGEGLKGVLEALRHPVKEMGTLWRFGKKQLASRLLSPEIPVHGPDLKKEAKELGARVRDFGIAVQQTLAHFSQKGAAKWCRRQGRGIGHHGNGFPKPIHARALADSACDLYASSCALARLDHLHVTANGDATQWTRNAQAGRYFLALANRRIKQNLAALWTNDDEATTPHGGCVSSRLNDLLQIALAS